VDITYVVAGRLTRDYILPPVGLPLLDAPGGSGLYACGGVRSWQDRVGLMARVGEDYPRRWLKELDTQGVDTAGVTVLGQDVDVRAFCAYDTNLQSTRSSPVSQFARRKLAFPKGLLGYQTPSEASSDARRPDVLAPSALEIPVPYREALAVHLCPLDLTSHVQLANAFRASSANTLTVDPSPAYMKPQFMRDMRALLAGVSAFFPSEEELRALFWGQTYDLWQMLSAVGEFGCEIVVAKRGGQGQAVLDVEGKHKWEIPAYPARLADPTGAGDAYCGGFLAGLKKTYDPLQAALYGNVAASLAVEGSGALYALGVAPGLAEARLSVMNDLVREV